MITKRELHKIQRDIAQHELNIYAGILFNNQKFDQGNSCTINYKFDCPQFNTLKNKYRLAEIAGNGPDFAKAKKLLHYFAPKLHHSSWYDNHIACNALDLLEYSFDNADQGINCLNKSKILQECCLALGIYARRVSIMPYSPYDFDNHVVVEIFDRHLDKWIMLDPTTDGYFVDENATPLSLLEMREKFANAQFVTFVSSKDKLTNLTQLREKYVENNAYICKNLFYFYVDQDSTFGTTGKVLAFVPVNYSIKNLLIANTKYRINNLPEEYSDWLPHYQKRLEKLQQYVEDCRTDIHFMRQSPNQ